jgi:hypothetical protein
VFEVLRLAEGSKVVGRSRRIVLKEQFNVAVLAAEPSLT